MEEGNMLYGDERGIPFPYSLLTPSKLLVHYVVLVPEFFSCVLCGLTF